MGKCILHLKYIVGIEPRKICYFKSWYNVDFWLPKSYKRLEIGIGLTENVANVTWSHIKEKYTVCSSETTRIACISKKFRLFLPLYLSENIVPLSLFDRLNRSFNNNKVGNNAHLILYRLYTLFLPIVWFVTNLYSVACYSAIT